MADSHRFFPFRHLRLVSSLPAFWFGCLGVLACLAGTTSGAAPAASARPDPLAWPAITREARPWAYWWWMASAVDETNLSRELTRYQKAGMGGVHIVPIYGAKGFESRYIDYLSPQWMRMLDFTVTAAAQRDLGVDMTTGSGWCFGGPRVTDLEANAVVVPKIFEISAGKPSPEKLDPGLYQTVVAFSPDGRSEDLRPRLTPDGSLAWTPPDGTWRIYAVSQKPSNQKVKRAGPGGQGHMLNLIYPDAIRSHLRWFDEAFNGYSGATPRAMYHDSYEYRSDWAPDLLQSFARLRGYRLETEFPALFARTPFTNANLTPDRIARVKSDYRETVSDVMAGQSLPHWADWSRQKGFLTRNQAHGSPGNLLDLYAAADIPETEMFHTDRNKLVSKLASSAAHTSGRKLVSAETGTWLKEHWTETLADMKYLLDDLFLSGVNHIFYHGTCYSPDDAPWPGWLFYASYEMNPRNPVWRDVPALNTYAARCQAILQSGQPDNDLLLYWPIHDFWHNPEGMVRNMSVHARDWLENQPFGKTADHLWTKGYAFDYVSDRQLALARAGKGGIEMPGGFYRAVLVPEARLMPLPTFERLIKLAEGGATVIFQSRLPEDVPGWGDLASRRAAFSKLLEQASGNRPVRKLGRGRIVVGELDAALTAAKIPRESLHDRPGLMCLRRNVPDGHFYFIANRSDLDAHQGWVTLSREARQVIVMDPMTGKSRIAAFRARDNAAYLDLLPGSSVILKCLDKVRVSSKGVKTWEALGTPLTIAGDWKVEFLEGGPELPEPTTLPKLLSWNEFNDTNAHRFAGTARYSISFPGGPGEAYWIDLGGVAQSARVRLNGEDLGTVFIPPFRVTAERLKPSGNLLEIEVTSVAANRIRDMDRRGVVWRNFNDINFVNINYKPFDASNWPLTPAGLLGPVTMTPIAPRK